MLEMYKGQINSPILILTETINERQTEIKIKPEKDIPELPNLLVIGEGSNVETVKVLKHLGGGVLKVERGFQGENKAWKEGTPLVRNFTAYDHDTFIENIKFLEENTLEQIEKFSEEAVLSNEVDEIYIKNNRVFLRRK